MPDFLTNFLSNPMVLIGLGILALGGRRNQTIGLLALGAGLFMNGAVGSFAGAPVGPTAPAAPGTQTFATEDFIPTGENPIDFLFIPGGGIA